MERDERGHTTRTNTTRRMAAVMMKKPAKKRMMRPILRRMVVRRGRMTGAGMSIMHRSVTRFMMRGGSMLSVDWGLQYSVCCLC